MNILVKAPPGNFVSPQGEEEEDIHFFSGAPVPFKWSYLGPGGEEGEGAGGAAVDTNHIHYTPLYTRTTDEDEYAGRRPNK